MKKLKLIVLTLLVSIAGIFAQEVNSSQILQNNTLADSLSLKLNQLQRDYDYLRCDYELKCTKNELAIFCNQVNISSNGVLLNCYNSSFNYKLYTAYKNSYEAYLDTLESLENKITSLIVFVALKVRLSDFSDEEINLLQMTCESFDLQINSAKRALDYYKLVIDMYLQS